MKNHGPPAHSVRLRTGNSDMNHAINDGGSRFRSDGSGGSGGLTNANGLHGVLNNT